MPRVIGGSEGGGHFVMAEVPLYTRPQAGTVGLMLAAEPSYMGTSLTRTRLLLGPYSRTMPKAL